MPIARIREQGLETILYAFRKVLEHLRILGSGLYCLTLAQQLRSVNEEVRYDPSFTHRIAWSRVPR
jgi:hypothetical protein